MGNIKDTKIKTYAREIIKKFPEEVSLDFDENKKLLNENCEIHGKLLRNRIAGCIVSELKTKNNNYENIKRELYENKNKRKKRKVKEEGY